LVAHAFSLRDGIASGADRWRRLLRISFSHRVSSAIATSKPAQVSRRPGDWRWKLPQRHESRRKSRRAPRVAGSSLQVSRAVIALVDLSLLHYKIDVGQ